MGRIKLKMSKRQENAAAKRAAILASPAFRLWWEARQDIAPVPSDPYRAFMIDIGLNARVLPKEYWENRTNRSDYPPVDLPSGVPSSKRRPPSRKQMKRWKKVPKAAQPLVLTPYEQKLVKMIREEEETYHLPATKIRIEPRLRYSYAAKLFGQPMILIPKEHVAVAEKKRGGSQEQVEASILHEFGHHAHAAYSGVGKLGGEMRGALTPVIAGRPFKIIGTSREIRLGEERVAWDIAKKVRKTKKPWSPHAAWLKKYALGTYLGTSPPRRS